MDLRPHEVIAAITLPLPQSRFEFVQPYKQARRREDDISIVTGCIRMRLAPSPDKGVWVIEEAGLGFGGMAPTTVAAPKTEAFLVGKVWSAATIQGAAKVLREDLPLPASVPGGQAEYRRTLPPSFLLKFFVKTSLDLAVLAAEDTVGGVDVSWLVASVRVVDRPIDCLTYQSTDSLPPSTTSHPTVPAPRARHPRVGALGRPLLSDRAQALLARGAALHGRPRGRRATGGAPRAARGRAGGGGVAGPRGRGEADHAQERAGAGKIG